MEDYVIGSDSPVGMKMIISHNGSLEDAIKSFASSLGLTYKIIKSDLIFLRFEKFRFLISNLKLELVKLSLSCE